MEQQLKYYDQQKIYRQVVAPLDGVITQRNIDVRSFITAVASPEFPLSRERIHVVK
jgi:multidrug efflux pump subunit AcrA (membrane-fusion protein)